MAREEKKIAKKIIKVRMTTRRRGEKKEKVIPDSWMEKKTKGK